MEQYLNVPSYTISIAPRYPTAENGSLVANVTQKEAAEFIRNYNEAHKIAGNDVLIFLKLFEDEQVRDYLGKDHVLFDENFSRNGQPWRWGYVADFTMPYGNGEEGIEIFGSKQLLVTRIAYWRLPDGDVELGPVTIAPDGMVPTIGRNKIEKMIGAKGLKRLEQLRGKEIYEKGDETVDVRDALGYPQLTLSHEARDSKEQIIPHSDHSYRPEQNYDETVGVRSAYWNHHGGPRCFYVYLDVAPSRSDSYRSFPLVRGGGVKAILTRPGAEISL